MGTGRTWSRSGSNSAHNFSGWSESVLGWPSETVPNPRTRPPLPTRYPLPHSEPCFCALSASSLHDDNYQESEHYSE